MFIGSISSSYLLDAASFDAKAKSGYEISASREISFSSLNAKEEERENEVHVSV